MATATKINKSEAVRKALAKHPDKKPRWIAELLVGKKIEVTPGVVSTIKSKMKSSHPVKKAKKSKGNAQSIGQVQDTIIFIRGVGGVDKAKQLISLIEDARNF